MSCPGWMLCHWEIDFPPLYITTQRTTSDANTNIFTLQDSTIFYHIFFASDLDGVKLVGHVWIQSEELRMIEHTASKTCKN